jgi:transposase-like protein
MASKYDIETKAKALALIEWGKPASHVAQQMGLNERTVQMWAKRFREISAKEEDDRLLAEHYRIAEHAFALTHDALDELDEEPEKRKYLVPLNIVGGTHVDKILKRSERPAVAAQNITINFIAQKPPDREDPDVVEGEIVEEDGDPDGDGP